MKVAGLAGLAALTVLGVHGLADLTQNRPGPVVEGSVTTVAFEVATHDFHGSDAAAAPSLWAVCQPTVSGHKSDVTGSGDGFRVTVSPAFGENGRKRLTGCLEDATVDRVLGHVTSLSHTPP